MQAALDESLKLETALRKLDAGTRASLLQRATRRPFRIWTARAPERRQSREAGE